MTITETTHVCTAAAAVIAACGSVCTAFVSLRNSRKLDVVKKQTDGIHDALVKEVRTASFAEGVKAEAHRNGSKS